MRTGRLEPSSGTRPRRQYTEPKRAASDAMRMSIASTWSPHANGRPVHRSYHGFETFETSHRELAATLPELPITMIRRAIGQPFHGSALRVAIK